MNKKSTYLVFDASNVLYRTFFVNAKEDHELLTGLAYHSTMVTLFKYYKKYKPTHVVLTFDRENWRKKYTQDPELCVSGKIYKGHRRQSMTPSEKARYELFKEFIAAFEELMRTHSNIICMGADGLEADDFMAGICQVFGDDPDVEIVIVSSDKDLTQLLKYRNVDLIDPITSKPRTHDNIDFFLFEKCLRGDIGDNVQSAYPRIRTKKIEEAFRDEFAFVNIMNETWTNHENKEFTVKHLFEENRLLMDLTAQPECVRRILYEAIFAALENPGTYSHFHMIKFLAKNNLKKLVKQLDTYVPMLSGKGVKPT